MKQYEAEVFEDFKKYANVVEAWALYDSIVISPTLYGNEQNNAWFLNFNDFGAQETHTFFKTRTEGTAGLQYCNQQSADSMDFAFIADSIGLAVQGPAPDVEGVASEPEGVAGQLDNPDNIVSHWFSTDLPRHMAIQLKVQQDIRAEITAMHCPPGYGAVGSGTAFPFDLGIPSGEIPFMTNAVVQGVPLLSNRYPLPSPIGIPRTATIEGILHVSEYARTILTNIIGPQNYQFNSDDGNPPYTFFQKRYQIQFSLFGQRLVQQRAQYHR